MNVSASQILEFLLLARQHDLKPFVVETLEGHEVRFYYPGDLNYSSFAISKDDRSCGRTSFRSHFESLLNYDKLRKKQKKEEREKERLKLLKRLTDYEKELLGVSE